MAGLRHTLVIVRAGSADRVLAGNVTVRAGDAEHGYRDAPTSGTVAVGGTSFTNRRRPVAGVNGAMETSFG